jgi:hypothetical protein
MLDQGGETTLRVDAEVQAGDSRLALELRSVVLPGGARRLLPGALSSARLTVR